MVKACVLYTQDSGIVTHLTNKNCGYRLVGMAPHFQCGIGSVRDRLPAQNIIWGYGDNWLTRGLCKPEMGYHTPLAPLKNNI